jgi:hypothetical protein
LVIHVKAERLQFIENKLEIGFHHSQISVEAGIVVVVDWVRFQIVVVGISSTDQINLGSDLRDFTNSTRGWRQRLISRRGLRFQIKEEEIGVNRPRNGSLWYQFC